MELAKGLLSNSRMSVTSIGYEAGFKDPSYFAQAFKQCLGCTPSEYRDAGRTPLPELAGAPLESGGAGLLAHP